MVAPGYWLAGRLSARQVDRLVFAVALLLSTPTFVLAARSGSERAVAAAVTVPFGTLPLLWRRTRPRTVLLVLAAAFTVATLLTRSDRAGAGLVFGVYAAAFYGDRRTRRGAGAVALGALLFAFGLVLGTGTARALGHAAGVAFGCGIAWVAGDRTRTRHAYLAELESRAQRLELERDEQVRRAGEEERTRIARELHDVVVHNVSVIAVQAGAARRTAHAHPDRAFTALTLVERTARDTLAELRALLGVLRRPDGAPPRQPQPTLAQVDALLAPVRDAGLDVSLTVDGAARPLPAMVELCAYRVVQEALTNAVKHAPQAQVHVLIRYHPAALELAIVDDGPGTDPAGSAGHGLIGMRERVDLLGGALEAGSAPAGGFRVTAWLPLRSTDPLRADEPAPAGQPLARD